MFFIALISLFLQFRGLVAQALDSNGVSLDQKVLAIERLLLTPGTVISPVTPCSNAINGADGSVSGNQIAAQWVRTVFHDFVTADVAAGTGGLDASIGFEADRPENLGLVYAGSPDLESFANATINGLAFFGNVFVSTSDLIAMGLVTSLQSCDALGPRFIPLRAGRVDATGPGPTGVPLPTDPVSVQGAKFAKAGFSQTEMIQAVACGHSIGGVHDNNFPRVVGTQTTVGFEGADHFDSTPFSFDNANVNEYLSGTGQQGGPLVTTQNTTFRSDLRIFSSDNNATVKAMSSAQAFENTCFTVFEKMINTIPKGITLSNVIGPRTWITIESHLDLLTVVGSDGRGVLYSGTIATWSPNSSVTAPSTASYIYGTVGGGNTGPEVTQAGVAQSNTVNGVQTAPFGTITWYTFNDTLRSPVVTSLTVENTYTEAINTNLFVLPSQSFVNGASPPQYIVRAAVLTSLVSGGTVTGTLYYPALQQNSVAPKYTQVTTTLTSFKTKGNYTIFQGVLTQGPSSNGNSHVDVQLGTQRSAKVQASTSFLSQGLFGTCTNANLITC